MFMHNKRLQYTLRVSEPNLPGIERYTFTYVNAFQRPGDAEDPWNSGEQWTRIDDIKSGLPLDGQSDGAPSVDLPSDQLDDVELMTTRLRSQPSDPLPGAELGAGPGAGKTSKGDKGGAADIEDAAAQARALVP